MRVVPEAVAVGPTVTLRRPTESDRQAWIDLVVASREFLAGWIQVPGIDEDPDGARWFDATLAKVVDDRFEKLLVCLRDGEALVGAVNFNEIVRGSFHSAYLGYWIGADYAGRGLMTEALGLALTHGFKVLHLHRVEANLQPDNTASRALVRKLGFVKEGFSESYLKIGEQWRDHERWALTVERWRGSTSAREDT